jgi:hypothetical protein
MAYRVIVLLYPVPRQLDGKAPLDVRRIRKCHRVGPKTFAATLALRARPSRRQIKTPEGGRVVGWAAGRRVDEVRPRSCVRSESYCRYLPISGMPVPLQPAGP